MAHTCGETNNNETSQSYFTTQNTGRNTHQHGFIFVVVESESKSQLVALGEKIKGKQKQVVLRNDGMSRGRWGHY